MRRFAVLGALLLVGCADDESRRAKQMEAATERGVELGRSLRGGPEIDARALVFRLTFDRSVDLDLYVTDPLQETVYFANHSSKAGGRLVSDIHCESDGPTPAIEEIHFDAPYPGSYRVGVDFPERCSGAGELAGFAVSVRGAGEAHAVSGVAELRQFEVIVLEFDLEGTR